MTLTRDLAYAAGRDAGNRSMRSAGRARWNRTDYKCAAIETNRLLDAIATSSSSAAHA